MSYTFSLAHSQPDLGFLSTTCLLKTVYLLGFRGDVDPVPSTINKLPISSPWQIPASLEGEECKCVQQVPSYSVVEHANLSYILYWMNCISGQWDLRFLVLRLYSVAFSLLVHSDINATHILNW